MKQHSILLVEDDFDLSLVTQDVLMDAGYDVQLAQTTEAAEIFLYENSFDMIILDINLPDETGFSFCERIRKTYDIPILFISARTSINDKLIALSIGGDDYLSKPYSLAELVARVHAHMRRNYQFLPNMNHESGPFELDFQAHTIKKNHVSIPLSEKEFAILSYLIKHKGTCISKEILFAEIWGLHSDAQDATVSVHIRWIREKLEDDPSHPIYLKTVWGRGYIWEDTK